MLRRFVSLHSDWAAAPPAVLQSGPKDLGLRTQSPREPAFLGWAHWALSARGGPLPGSFASLEVGRARRAILPDDVVEHEQTEHEGAMKQL